MDIITALGLTVGALVALFPLGYVAYINVGGIYAAARRSQAKNREAAAACRLDSDCPPGYSCRNGICVPNGA